MTTKSLADRLFDYTAALAEDDLIDYLWEQVGENEFGDWLWDSYDCSIELVGCKPEFRLTPAILEWLWENGFHRVWLQHEDNMETAYHCKGPAEGHRGPLSAFRVERAAVAAGNRGKVAKLVQEVRQLKQALASTRSTALDEAAGVVTTGEFCYTPDHMQNACDCAEMTAAIRALKGGSK